ncbi:hypothetical protein ONS95_005888 [Cadophora gregata]|uniref:uncharacterized protein n=1 Tax=Cadophora gregata TaxID=51156 RepID=UPI0026DB34AC|nr:uncharacterized protein ONS95_005888 [Cadophora gregata]KAK0102266.1 hypothetical protein ONS95_005888 [Cadophora gregata]KAK0103893.1 hypothetical protein ONS96_005001 [Cadophora gregata f. sp. sojae]
MSPIPIRLLHLTTPRRAFSIATRVRTLARSFEPHPFERMPTTQKPARGDWGRQARRVGDSAMFYFPFMGLVLSWPVIAEQFLDGKMR